LYMTRGTKIKIKTTIDIVYLSNNIMDTCAIMIRKVDEIVRFCVIEGRISTI
jgi:hypothetical protein